MAETALYPEDATIEMEASPMEAASTETAETPDVLWKAAQKEMADILREPVLTQGRPRAIA
ncbi:hypothetical protein COU77_02370 [Candidatus Peregrinibacteria bacterium CG10_big_fil_rev_8_21_14_0_10_49_16]|nr:MAG: hypothetical protein COW95_00855 [Candidatus Peregrinibacteria bacterium CG22_combo_CG10-13_8_21_14_all_49_11]PIR52056.1 MAG: hypothetical protein COU77_02370 [Candidatus Peregrinibacteria bacterium CG10_big_fil_rev_8_21_14_0_10_49_16]